MNMISSQRQLCTARIQQCQRYASSRNRWQSRQQYQFATRLRNPVVRAIPASNNNILSFPARRHFTVSSLLMHEFSVKAAVSESQRRSAQLELDRMTLSTSRLLGMDLKSARCTTTTSISLISETSSKDDQVNALSDAIVNEARVALHYWSRRWYMHFHPGFGRAAKGSALSLDALRQWDKLNTIGNGIDICGVESMEELPTIQSGSDTQPEFSMQNVGGDFGARQAERLFDWSLSNNLVPRGVFDLPRDSSHMEKEDRLRGQLGVSPNLACVNIIETYLLPTAYGGAGGGNGCSADTIILPDLGTHATLAKHFTINASFVRAVADATRVMKKMIRLQSEFPEYISSDSLSVKAELNVWAKRAILLGKNQRPIIREADNAVGCDIDESGCSSFDPIDLLKSLELEDVSTNGGEVYSDDTYTFQGCLDQMETILANSESRYILTKDERMRPSCDWYNHVLGTWARSTDIERAMERTKQILHGMEVYQNSLARSDYNVNDRSWSTTDHHQYLASPDIVSYNSVLYCLTRDPGKSRAKAKEAEALLRKLKERYRETKNVDVRPDEITYGLVLHSLAQAGMAHEAESLLDQLEDDKRDGAIIPSLTIYNTVLNAWANSHLPNAPKRAETLLDRMKSHASIGKNPGVEPDSISISTVISCHARSQTRSGAERGEQLLNEAVAMYLQGNARVKPDAIMFNCAISGWTNISGIESEQGSTSKQIPAIRAELLLQKMKGSQLNIQPVVQTFNQILDCWSKSEIKGCADRAIELLREMPQYGVGTDEISYNSVLHAMTKESDPKWLAVAEDILQEMKEKNIPISQITYHVMMNIYAKSSDNDGANKAELLLRGMEEEGLAASDISYNICIDAFARRGDYRKAESLLEEMMSLSNHGKVECQPSIHSFASVVNALAKSRDLDAVSRAEEIVQRVEQLDYVSPNSILYNSLIDCVVKSRRRDNASHAEEILRRMEHMHRAGNSNVKPNAYAYSMVLTCCARSEEPGSAERAERILLNMENLYAEGLSDAVANSRCYSAAITAWARSNSPIAVDRALALIDRMEQNGKHGSPHGKPNTHCYNAYIHAIAKSQHPHKAEKCKEVLQRMTAAVADGFYDSAPSSITYSTIINACAYTRGNDKEKKEAFNLAQTCFQTLLSSKEMEPCVSSFANFFRVISRHLKHGAVRDQFAEAVFLEGYARGKMDDQALNDFRKASPKVAEKILSKYRNDEFTFQ